MNIGIDLGGTNIVAALVDLEGTIKSKKSILTLRERSSNQIMDDMVDLVDNLLADSNFSKNEIISIGIGSPGTCDSEKGIIEYVSNLNFRDVNIVDYISKKTGIPVYLANDANAAAVGEYQVGAGEGYTDLVAITLGTGVGSGIIIDNKIVTGKFNGGGEFGHTVIELDGKQCNCGRKGCWEQYSSATALINVTKQAAVKHKESIINKLVNNDIDKITAKTPFDAAQMGDNVAIDIIDSYIKSLAVGIGNIIAVIQPDVIVIGGGISAQKDNLLIPLNNYVENEIIGGKNMLKTDIKIAELGNDAGIIGASMLYKLLR